MAYKKHIITKKARENIIELWEILTTNYKHDISVEQLSEILLRNVIINEIDNNIIVSEEL